MFLEANLVKPSAKTQIVGEAGVDTIWLVLQRWSRAGVQGRGATLTGQVAGDRGQSRPDSKGTEIRLVKGQWTATKTPFSTASNTRPE